MKRIIFEVTDGEYKKTSTHINAQRITTLLSYLMYGLYLEDMGYETEEEKIIAQDVLDRVNLLILAAIHNSKLLNDESDI